MAAAKAADKIQEIGGKTGEPLSVFHGYNLDSLEIPMAARPLGGQLHLGKHGYTLHGGNAVICLKGSVFSFEMDLGFFSPRFYLDLLITVLNS